MITNKYVKRKNEKKNHQNCNHHEFLWIGFACGLIRFFVAVWIWILVALWHVLPQNLRDLFFVFYVSLTNDRFSENASKVLLLLLLLKRMTDYIQWCASPCRQFFFNLFLSNLFVHEFGCLSSVCFCFLFIWSSSLIFHHIKRKIYENSHQSTQ